MSQATEKHLNSLIPTPKKLERMEGDLALAPVICAEHEPFSEYAKTFCDCTQKIYDKPIVSIGTGGIVMRLDEGLKKSTYTLDTLGDTAVLSASDNEGILYALSTLINISVLENDTLKVSRVHIEDAPDKEYRTLMVDLAREWHPAHLVLRYIDVCFMMKVRYLHLHFIDDQRYTLPSHAYPDVTKNNRHYTFEDIDSFRRYARERGIILIPEFEVPGHAVALVRAYPEIFKLHLEGNADDANIVTENGDVIWADGIVCAGSAECEKAIRIMLREICEMFPESPYIHIGGDEANIKAWSYCSECVKYMKEHGIKDVKELYSEFTGRVAQIVLDLGRTPIVWEGFPKEGSHFVPKETVVLSWENYYHYTEDLLEEGFRIINASWQPLYIVPAYGSGWGCKEIYAWDVYNWQHWWEKSRATVNPVHVSPTDQVIGAQICAWESTYDQEINSILENLATLSERTWNTRRVCSHAKFEERLRPFLQKVARLIQDK